MRPDIHILKPFAASDAAPVSGEYGGFSDPVPLEELPDFMPIGSVVAIRPHAGTGRSDLRSLCGAVADRVVNAPLALWTDRAVGGRFARALTGDQGLPIRAALSTLRANAKVLRVQLTDEKHFPRQVVRWIGRRRDLDATTIAMLTLMAEADLGKSNLRDCLARSGFSGMRWRRHCKARDLGPPSAWYQALRITRMGIALQRTPRVSIERIALRFGFSSANTFSDRMYDVIGYRPSIVRTHLGWEWILFHALRRLNPGRG